MKNIFVIICLFLSCSKLVNAQSTTEFKIYNEEELAEQFKLIDRQIKQESITFRKNFIKENVDKYYDPELLSIYADFQVETMIIDSTLQKKLNIVYRNTDFPFVISEAADEYDRLLNKYYKLLMGIMPDDLALLFREHQRVWLTFRDTNMKFQHAVYYDYDFGRIGQAITYYTVYLEMYRLRVKELFDYYITFYDTSFCKY